MNGVERGGANEFESLVEGESAFHVFSEALHVAEGGVTFVAVVNVLLDAEFVECEHTADAEEIFLLDAVFPVTAIEAVSDAAVVFGVEFVVGVEEVERDATHVGSPECGVHHEVGVGHIHDDLIAVGVEDAFDGEAVKVLGFIVRNLLSVHGERLSEVAVAIEEADSSHVDARV